MFKLKFLTGSLTAFVISASFYEVSHAQEGYACFTYGFGVHHKEKTVYHTPVISYRAPDKCPKGTDFVRKKQRLWVDLMAEKGLNLSQIDNKSTRTYCECNRANQNTSADKAHKFTKDALAEAKHKYRDYTFVIWPDFNPE